MSFKLEIKFNGVSFLYRSRMEVRLSLADLCFRPLVGRLHRQYHNDDLLSSRVMISSSNTFTTALTKKNCPTLHALHVRTKPQ